MRTVGVSVNTIWSHSPTLDTFTTTSIVLVVGGVEVDEAISISQEHIEEKLTIYPKTHSWT